jgi:hypothetical protein
MEGGEKKRALQREFAAKGYWLAPIGIFNNLSHAKPYFFDVAIFAPDAWFDRGVL